VDFAELIQNDPLAVVGEWFADAARANPDNADAAALATVAADGYPQARTVLVKSFSPAGFFFFYTNLESRKAKALAASPRAALLWYWRDIRRQISVEGEVVTMPEEKVAAYFAARPRASQIGAWASCQSAPLESAAVLERQFQDTDRRFANREIPPPPHWGGYELCARRIEFWLQGEARLHSRAEFTRPEAGAPWQAALLYP
jgi:pyridoxamine 5'-phosphate oxidase